MNYYSRNLNWFNEDCFLPNMTKFIGYSTFFRLDFASLKVEDVGIYKCYVTDNPSEEYKCFQLIPVDT